MHMWINAPPPLFFYSLGEGLHLVVILQAFCDSMHVPLPFEIPASAPVKM